MRSSCFRSKRLKIFLIAPAVSQAINWVLVGDAFGFLDPVYSTGLFLALKSGEMAADVIIEAFQKEDFSEAQLGSFGPAFVDGMEAFRKLVYAFYTKEIQFCAVSIRIPGTSGGYC